MYTALRLQKEVNEILRKANVKMACPVRINNRLSRTLGRATMAYRNRVYISARIDFSGDLIARATDTTIREVLLHECAHVIANLRTQSNNGHNAFFKQVCHEIGTHNDKTSTKVEWREDAVKPVAKAVVKRVDKYEVNCPNCGVIARYNRACNATKHPEIYMCRKCCGGNLFVKVNR